MLPKPVFELKHCGTLNRMKKFRIGLLIGAVMLVIAELAIIDYDRFWESKNVGNYLIILSMILVILSLVGAIKTDKK